MGTTVLLSRLAAATELLVIDLIAQHDVEPDPKLAGRGDPRLAQSLLLQLAPVEALQLWILANGVHRCLAPEKTQQRVALLAQRTQPLPTDRKSVVQGKGGVDGAERGLASSE